MHRLIAKTTDNEVFAQVSFATHVDALRGETTRAESQPVLHRRVATSLRPALTAGGTSYHGDDETNHAQPVQLQLTDGLHTETVDVYHG